MTSQFFSDNEIRRWITQIIRLFSNYTVQYGLDGNGNQLYSRVPVIWGDSTFSAATVQKLNSENVMPSFPMMSIYINNLKYNRAWTIDPTYVDNKSVRTRQWDANIGAYLPAQGNAYNVKRLMPVPYTLSVNLDIVTSNTQQKLQILEQLLPLFNPSLEIQNSDNYMDWTSLSAIELMDVNWSNRTIPTGQNSDSSYDVCTLKFDAPIWLSLPAQVSKMGVIFKIINNIRATQDLDDLVYGSRQVITFNNYGVYASNGQLRILNQGIKTINGPQNDALYGEPLDWGGILSVYGNIRPGVSQVGLCYKGAGVPVVPLDYDSEILGTVTISPVDSTILLYNVHEGTLPANTLPAINGIVNPQEMSPGINLSNANIGQRYLLTSNIGLRDVASYTTSLVDQVRQATDNFSSQVNGIQTTFILTKNNVIPGSLIVTVSGIALTEGIDYILTGQSIIFPASVTKGTILLATYAYSTTPVMGFVGVIPGGKIDGINNVFTLSIPPNPPEDLRLFQNGILQKQGVDYTISNYFIKFTIAPSISDELLAIYRDLLAPQSNYSYASDIVPSGIQDGINTTFIFPQVPINPYVTVNGVLLTETLDYTISGYQIIFAVPPLATDVISSYYIYFYEWPYNTSNSIATAKINDIIMYDGTEWLATFVASENTGNVQFVWNLAANVQYKWDGNNRVSGWEGPYTAAKWRLII